MTEEFDLSEKIYRVGNEFDGKIDNVLDKEDVKEFIKKDEDLISEVLLGRISTKEFWEKRDKLAGGIN